MAHPAETAPQAPAAFGGARLTPEEADRLASTLRPSWELDNAPFTGPGSLSEDDLRALQGGGIHPAVRGVAHDASSRSHASNGSHAPPPPAPSREPESSVILDESLIAEISPPEPKPEQAFRPGATMLGMAAAQLPLAAPHTRSAAQPGPLSPSLQRPPTPQRPVAPSFQFSPPDPHHGTTTALDQDEPYPRKPKTTLWVVLGLGGVAAVGLVAWIATSSGSGESTAAPVASRPASNDTGSIIPPAATGAAVPPAAAVAPTPTLLAPVTVAPAADAVSSHVAATAAPRAAPNPVFRPAPKSKSNQTIVRDVPF